MNEHFVISIEIFLLITPSSLFQGGKELYSEKKNLTKNRVSDKKIRVIFWLFSAEVI